MHKFSIVIPTIWKSEYIHQMLDRYYECENVDEVILINNNRKNTPNFSRNKKLLYIEPDDNLYVNPAWNLGIKISKHENIIVANDDILYDINQYTNILIALINKFNGLNNVGIIGMYEDNYSLEKTSDLIELKPHGGKPAWACLFATHKSIWPTIPHQLKIYYGDDFLKMVMRNRIFDLIGFKIESIMSSSANTSIDWVKTITEQDVKEWNKIILNV